jgi:hypothetical protein
MHAMIGIVLACNLFVVARPLAQAHLSPDTAFSAEGVTVWTPPTNSGKPVVRVKWRSYRDRAGRLRVEQFFVGEDSGPHRVVITEVPTAEELPLQVAYVLDTVTRTVSKEWRSAAESVIGNGSFVATEDHAARILLPLSMHRVMGFYRLPAANAWDHVAIETEPLGDAVMAGIGVSGTRYKAILPLGSQTHVGELVDERWVSRDLQLVVYSRGEDAGIGRIEYQLTRIDLQEPPAQLFEVPTGFVQTEPRYPQVFENPYLPAGTPLPSALKNVP